MNPVSFTARNAGMYPTRKFDVSKNQENCASKNAQNKFNLPGYNLSFGMAKITKSDKYPELTLSDDEYIRIGNFVDAANDTLSRMSDNPDFSPRAIYKILSGKNDIAIKHFLKGNEKDFDFTKLNQTYIANYLQALDILNSDDESPELIRSVFTQTDKNGDTLATAASKISDSIDSCPNVRNQYNILDTIISIAGSFSDTNKILYDVLNAKDKDGRTAGVLFSQTNKGTLEALELSKKINEALFNLTTKDDEISVDESIEILKNNESILDTQNVKALDALMSGECELM